jgi:hypothetical protein
LYQSTYQVREGDKTRGYIEGILLVECILESIFPHYSYKEPKPIYTFAQNRARWISKGMMAAKAKWKADQCSKHYRYRLKGKAGSKRSISMTSVKSLGTRFYKLKSRHATTELYL